ncbi:uncharacterized protein B0H18DRAFT_983411 [Fomitopsis serialis]|uniref:uncharacterized protein n=1 Tax=Fomitopsis serialis TaxID=139415 RepID=UPI002008B8D2|nr:uncharacterized protein B0H18DRAFT_983411 [Neoantrodia serialis]KAH9933385.1 hypothetical protein B0H18DRAFT_983411 [Neoantrodia serialis]
MATYNATRFFEGLLEAHESSPPSFTVRLYPDFWQLNNGSKCLYNHQMASLLDDIRAQRIPVDFLELFDAAKLPFYDGCMIVETLEEPQKTRVVLSPNPETLWTDICLMNKQAGNAWSDLDALEVEARILIATAPPLCLDSDPHLTRMANNTLRASVPTAPLSLKRKAATEKNRRAKLAHFMNPKYTRPAVSAPSFRILEALQRVRMAEAAAAQAGNKANQAPTASSAPGYGAPGIPAAPAPAVSSYNQPSVPMPPAVPAAIAVPPPPVAAPAQPVATQATAEAVKRPRLGEATQQPPQVPRTSATPVQQVGHGPSAIPAHLQAHAVQMAHRTPPRASQSPHPPLNGASSSQTPPNTDARPPSAMQRPPSQPTHVTATPRPQSTHPVTAQPIHAPYQMPPQQAAVQNLLLKKKNQQAVAAAVAAANGTAAGAFPQPVQPGAHPQGQAASHYIQYYPPYQNATQQRLSQPGRSATPVNRSPMNSSQGSTPQRSSPLAGSQRLTTQSPMPTNTQQAQAQAQAHAQAQVQAQAQSQAQAQPGQPATQGNYNYAALQRAPANPQAAQQTAQQLQAANYMARYYYPVQPGQIPAGYWQMGRGGPVANGQVQMPNISTHTQQMQMNANKAVQGGVQGS